MARPVDPKLRQSLLVGTADFLLQNGYRETSLRPLAAYLGTSPRLLIFHFDSKDQLLESALNEVRQRQIAVFSKHLEPVPGKHYVEVLEPAWRFFAGKEAQRYFRLFQEVSAIRRLQSSDNDALTRRLTTEWFPIVIDGFRHDGCDSRTARDKATLTIATIRGLIMDLSSTREQKRVADGYRAFIEMMRSSRPLPSELIG